MLIALLLVYRVWVLPRADSLSLHVGRELGRRRCAGSVVLLVHSLPPVSYVKEKKMGLVVFRISMASEVFPLCCFLNPRKPLLPPVPPLSQARRCGYDRNTKHQVTGRDDRRAKLSSVTRHHRHGLDAPRPSRRARRGVPRGDPDSCRRHQTTKP